MTGWLFIAAVVVGLFVFIVASEALLIKLMDGIEAAVKRFFRRKSDSANATRMNQKDDSTDNKTN